VRSDRTNYNLLDFEFIAHRRRELGLSLRALGRLVGMNGVSLAEFERGASQAGLRADTITKLAHALHTEPHDLLRHDERARPSAQRDDIRLEAAILRSRRRRPLADYQRPLGLSPLQLRRAADRLERRLEGTGAELRRHGGFSIQPRGGVLTRKELRHLNERQSRRPALRLDQVRTLHQVMNGHVEALVFDGALHGGSFPATVGYLLKNGYIRENDGQYQLTDRVALSLGLNGRTQLQQRRSRHRNAIANETKPTST
jgi:transcriptional regulator with XRE-family HTH domain